MSTYDFSTKGGTSTQVSIPVNAAAEDSFRAEFSPTRNFNTISLTKSALTVSGDNVLLSLSSADIDTIKDCCFRIIGTRNSVDVELWSGNIAYTPATPVTTGSAAPPIIKRFVYRMTTTARFGFPITVTWDTPFPSSTYATNVTLLDPSASTQGVYVDTGSGGWVERGDGTGGTMNVGVWAPDLAAGQHIEVWAYV